MPISLNSKCHVLISSTKRQSVLIGLTIWGYLALRSNALAQKSEASWHLGQSAADMSEQGQPSDSLGRIAEPSHPEN